MRHVEIVGLPGAGKTSIRRRWRGHRDVVTLQELLRRERVRAARRHPRPLVRALPEFAAARFAPADVPSAGDAAGVALRYAAVQELTWTCALAVADLERREIATALVWDAWAERGYADRVGAPHERLLSDEGIWQRLAYLLVLAGAQDAGDVPVLPDPLPPLDALVVVDVPVDVAAQRALTRERGFKEVDLLPAMAGVLGGLVEVLRNREVPVLHLDGTRPVPEVRGELRRWLDAARR